MKSTFNTLFYLRKNRPNTNGDVPIMVRITINGQKTQFSAKIETHPNLWNTKIGRAIGRLAQAMSLNRLLDNLRSKIDTIYNKQLDEKGYVMPETIKNMVLGIDPNKKTLLDYFTSYNKQYQLKVGKTTTQITANRYELTKDRLKNFLQVEYNISDIMVPEITTRFIENFYLYLRNHHKCNNNSAMKFIQRFKTVFDYIVNGGDCQIQLNPFNNFNFKYEVVNRGFLTQEEIDLFQQNGVVNFTRFCNLRI